VLPILGAGARDIEAVAVGDETPGAYQWWYFDAVSDDGDWSMVAIFFVGGVFSALYADRLAAGVRASPLDHSMVHLVVHRRGRRVLWVFSEYPRTCLHVREKDLHLGIGGSSLRRCDDGRYEADIADDDFPRRVPVSARLMFRPEQGGLAPPGLSLSGDGRHLWGAPAPRCRVSFLSVSHGVRFEGSGYHDVNAGAEPLHMGWAEWSWGRTHLSRETRVSYDALHSSGSRISLRLSSEKAASFDEPDPLAKRRWTPWLLRLPAAPKIPGARTTVVLESSPFYHRHMTVFAAGATVGHGMHEYLNLRRFSRPSIRYMLRHRMYRRAGLEGPPFRCQVHRREVFPDDPV
jgi:carotenoid 1,2-hydratase